MAVTGRFVADFSDFSRAVDESVSKLVTFETGAGRVEKSLDRMVTAFSGKRVIQDATLMTEAIERIGSPARLTANELQRAGALAEEAAEKMRRMGQVVPPKLLDVSEAAKRARGETDGLRSAFSAFDGVLATLGVNLGPEIRGLEDMASASGKTAAQLGAFATAGLAAGAALAGWKIGRFIADFAKTDEIIGDATAKLLGWGDVAGEKAALKADMLAKASKEVGFQVTTLSTAMAVNQAAAVATTEANKKLSAQFEAEAKAAATAAKEIERVHQNNADKFFKLTQDWVKGIHERQEADRKAAAEAAENAKKRQDAEHEAAVKAQEDWAKSRDAFLDAEQQKSAEALKTAAALREQRLEAERIARNATTFADFSDPQQARALLARPERSREDFIRMYAGYSGGLEFAEQQYQVEQELRRRARRIVEADDALRRSESGGSSRGLMAGAGDVNIQVSGLLDPRTVDEVATKVGNEIARRIGVRLPAF